VRADAVGRAVEASLRGGPSDASKGPLRVLTATDRSGCRLVLVADVRHRPPVWTGLTLLDDSAHAVAEEKTHKRRWRAWLYWSNVLQFLEHGGGDSAQLTTALLDGFSADVLTVTGGAGWLSSTRIVSAAADGSQREPVSLPPVAVTTGLPAVPARTAEETPSGFRAKRDGAWDAVLEYVDPDEAGLAELAHALAELGVPAPEDGFELDEHGWQAELAWPHARLGVVLAPQGTTEEPDIEAQDRDRAFAAAQWDVRPAGGWTAEEIAGRLGINGERTSNSPTDHSRPGTDTTGHDENKNGESA
jgi:hypothetical protein